MPAQRSEGWFARPDVLAARIRLDDQYSMLGCSIGSPRMNGLVARMRTLLGEQVPDLEESLATITAKGPEPGTVAVLAEASILVFNEPMQSLAAHLDDLGVAKPLVPGAYGRLWSRHTVDAAWVIWAAHEANWRGPGGVSQTPKASPF